MTPSPMPELTQQKWGLLPLCAQLSCCFFKWSHKPLQPSLPDGLNEFMMTTLMLDLTLLALGITLMVTLYLALAMPLALALTDD